MRTTILAAVAQNGVIGRDGGLPWKLSSDLRRFKADTMGKPVIMGRKTWEGLGRPLPGRLNIVVTRHGSMRAEGTKIAGSLDAAISIAREHAPAAQEICIIGGGEIYAQAITMADRLRITHVLADVEGDTRFPPIDPYIWETISSANFPAGERDSHATRYDIHERRADRR